MTGPATSPSPLLIRAERPASNLPSDMAGLRAECRKRRLDGSGTKHDLMARLNADDLTHTRAFTTAINATRRPSADNNTQPKTAREFNTSRTLKAPKDSSAVDLAYLPEYDHDSSGATVNVPQINFNFADQRSSIMEQTPEPTVMKPDIITMTLSSGKQTFSPMADVHDNGAMPIDFHAVADSVSTATANTVKEVKEAVSSTSTAASAEEEGDLRQFFKGIVEDVMGKSGKKVAA